MTIEQILEAAGTSIGEIGIKQHEQGYFKLIVHVDENDEIDDAMTIDDFEQYYANANGWHLLYRVGTGTCKCNCDACVNGDDPKEWADGLEFCGDIEDVIEEKINELEQELIACRENN